MLVNGEQCDPSEVLKDTIEQNEERLKKIAEQKERLKQKIMVEWKQGLSRPFWRRCFEVMPYSKILETYEFIEDLVRTGYPVINKAALFVSQLKKMGYFPFKKKGK